jgi:purine-binding chemotaxis protein CheW
LGKRHVSFSLGSSSYCVPVDQVVQILRFENILPIPKAPPYVVGVVNLRGDVLPVVDLRTRFGLAGDDQLRKRRIVVVQLGKRYYGMLVDEVKEIVELAQDAAAEDAASFFGERPEFVQAVARRGESLFLVLDLARIFSAPAVPVARSRADRSRAAVPADAAGAAEPGGHEESGPAAGAALAGPEPADQGAGGDGAP